MKYHLSYHGGLGDILLNMQVDNCSYNLLGEMEPHDTAVVGVTSPNPYAKELFTLHPKRKQIRCVFYPWDTKRIGYPPLRMSWITSQRQLDENWGANYAPMNDSKLIFYPTDLDKAQLDKLPENIIVIHAGAGDTGRVLPGDLAIRAGQEVLDHGYVPVYVGRSYAMAAQHNSHNEQHGVAEGAVSLIDKLSVPGTLALVDRAKGAITSYSSITIACWALQKKRLMLVHESIRDTIVLGRPRINVADQDPNCIWTAYGEINGHFERFFEWIS